jgi:hypothetical protein
MLTDLRGCDLTTFMQTVTLQRLNQMRLIQERAVTSRADQWDIATSTFADEEIFEIQENIIEPFFRAITIDHRFSSVNSLEDLNCSSVIRRIVEATEYRELRGDRIPFKVPPENFLAVLAVDDAPFFSVSLFTLVFDDREGALNVFRLFDNAFKGTHMITV